MAMLACFVIPPCFMILFYFCVAGQVKYHNYKVDVKYEKLNREA